jgi:uncharacterized protein YjiS (DUF1127 family)
MTIAILTSFAATVRKWMRLHRERQQLASLTPHERYTLSLLGDVDAEIAKPFWRD